MFVDREMGRGARVAQRLRRRTAVGSEPFAEELFELLATAQDQSHRECSCTAEKGESRRGDVLRRFLQSSHERRARLGRAVDRREEARRHKLDKLVPALL